MNISNAWDNAWGRLHNYYHPMFRRGRSVRTSVVLGFGGLALLLLVPKMIGALVVAGFETPRRRTNSHIVFVLGLVRLFFSVFSPCGTSCCLCPPPCIRSTTLPTNVSEKRGGDSGCRSFVYIQTNEMNTCVAVIRRFRH